ncbi:FAD/NAD(P)-binding domain-containing protein [Paraphaeosphaeria sporulosa]|uniref:FAD/NAD(P)-binding domain-containing protein n=1 Tax=Paraphaeosphaeria sporulosa TaxID=1460663 RepID=A0A177BWQ8_9PLEO|nr:FAD/NAD(P)-binding domain-containing protein [Paraphaeosphaeria sporulosa]OAF99390.1 FAD/NAD(P)-binding domain-containing protein [Paraphaeosphaeria sporulosa]
MAAAAAMSQLPPEQLKFMQEAAKRQRPEGTKQFQELHYSDSSRLRNLVDDIFADHAALDKRALPIEAGGNTKFLIMGAGMGGILNAIKLVQAGFKQDDIVMVEMGGGVGGTWYWNRYPGLHCDVESYVYLPMLEETGYVPSHKYTSAVEIRNYLVKLVEKFGLGDRIMYRTEVTSLQWDGGKKIWRVDMTTGRGNGGTEKATLSVNADFSILAGGIFPHPHVPKIPGLAGFEGDMFHTSRWDYAISGGSSEDTFSELKGLEGKRVGYVGTGATAIQAVPEVAKFAKELLLFQRTPSQVNYRGQKPTDPKEWSERIAAGLGWQKARMENLAQHLSRNLPEGTVNMVDDEWSRLQAYCAVLGSERFTGLTPDKIPGYLSELQAWDANHNTKARERISNIVTDKSTAERLTPWYPTWCKRPTFSDTYLQTFNKPNVHLVDTDGKGIDAVTSHAIIANGQEYPIDILILSTGYRSPAYGGGDPAARNGIDIIGRNGLKMSEKWTSRGATTLHGVFSHDFPNLFFFAIAQASATANVNHTLEVQTSHIISIISHFSPPSDPRERKVAIEPSAEAEEMWAMRCLSGAAFFSSVSVCTPGYITMEGDAMNHKSQEEMIKAGRGSPWSAGIVPFERMLEGWRADGFDGVITDDA